ncbi:MAG: 2-oxo acid dehydrogenase subunit E2 [Anaerolineae bacterium]
MRSRIAARMIDAKQQIPHFYVTIEIDVEALLNLRKQINAGLDDAHKVTVNDLIVKATALTLRDFPNLNTHFYGDRVARHEADQHRHRRDGVTPEAGWSAWWPGRR